MSKTVISEQCWLCKDPLILSMGPGRKVGPIARSIEGVFAPLPDDFEYAYCGKCNQRNMTQELKERFWEIEKRYLERPRQGVDTMNIVIVGVGALGSHLVQFLRNEKATLTVVDYDRVETKNIASQFHSRRSVGQKKVQSLFQSMNFLYARSLYTNHHKLTNDNVEQILGDANLVIDCLDNGEGRRVIQNYVRANSIACLHGALAADGAFGRVVFDEDFVIDDETGAGAATCEDGDHLPFIALTSAYLACAAQRYLRDGKKVGWSISPAGVQRI
jgi:tRNA A37 threonylcarbamoyladenosine dehydratase